MSAGSFENGLYQNIAANVVYPIRAQPETKEAEFNSVANDYPAGPATTGVSRIRLRAGRRAFGPAIRTASVELTADGTGAQAEYTEGSVLTIPIFAQATYAAWNVGQTGTYLGIAAEIVGIFPSK